jgi:hypothetical protein
MVGVAEGGHADGAAGKVLDALDLACARRGGHGGEERQASGGGKTADVGALAVGLQGHVEGGGRVIDGTADQRLHGSVAAARIDELDVEALGREMTIGARHLVGHDAEELATEGELDALALGLG